MLVDLAQQGRTFGLASKTYRAKTEISRTRIDDDSDGYNRHGRANKVQLADSEWIRGDHKFFSSKNGGAGTQFQCGADACCLLDARVGDAATKRLLPHCETRGRSL